MRLEKGDSINLFWDPDVQADICQFRTVAHRMEISKTQKNRPMQISASYLATGVRPRTQTVTSGSWTSLQTKLTNSKACCVLISCLVQIKEHSWDSWSC